MLVGKEIGNDSAGVLIAEFFEPSLQQATDAIVKALPVAEVGETEPVTAPVGTDEGVQGYGEPCPVCGKPKTKIVPAGEKNGRKWEAFAG